jgi:hypothetical protein
VGDGGLESGARSGSIGDESSDRPRGKTQDAALRGVFPKGFRIIVRGVRSETIE